MLTTHPNSVVQKRDLHVGGLGSSASGALAAVTEPVAGLADSWLHRARSAAQDADGYVHDNPWAALAVVALVAFAARLPAVAVSAVMTVFDDVRRFSNHRQWRDFIAALHETVTCTLTYPMIIGAPRSVRAMVSPRRIPASTVRGSSTHCSAPRAETRPASVRTSPRD